MLNIRVKFAASELTPGLNDGVYQVAPDVSVRELLAVCEQQCGAAIPEKNYRQMLLIFNGRNAQLDTPINKDGTLHVCRIIMGG